MKGALQGGTLRPLNRYGDLENKISLGTAAVFLSKDRFKENQPYSVEVVNGTTVYFINLHFLAEARRELAGDPEIGTSTFSPMERVFMDLYYDYINDDDVPDNAIPALEAFDDWLVDELVGNTHPLLTRVYAEDHKWNKTLSYTDKKGIQWI